MILFTVLALTVIFLMMFLVVMVSVGGASLLIIFGDVFVCIAILVWMIKKLCFKKK